MKNRAIPLLLLVILSTTSAAQTDSASSRPSYFLTVHSGLLLGKQTRESWFSVSGIQGLRYKRFHVGIGVGYDTDFSNWQLIPLFVSAGYDVLKGSRNALFVQGNIGYAKARSVMDEDQYNYSEEGGYFYQPVVGYRLTRDGKVFLYLTVGYKVQHLRYEESNLFWSMPGRRITVDRELQRLSLQIGFGWQ